MREEAKGENELEEEKEITDCTDMENIVVETPKHELNILVTDADKNGVDISKMSDFFGLYVQELSSDLTKETLWEQTEDIPIANLGILGEVLHYGKAVITSGVELVPDFESLPKDIKEKFEKGIYKLGESRQVDGNLRAVIVDENGTRVKDITFKEIMKTPETIDTMRSITNQIQMQQIYAKLDSIHELQLYQVERERDVAIRSHFLNARHWILLAQEETNEEARKQNLKKASDELTTAINNVYLEIKTTTESLLKQTQRLFFRREKLIDTYIEYLSQDIQLSTKFVGMQLQVMNYLGENHHSKIVLDNYQYMLNDFFNKAITKDGKSVALLIHMNYPNYTKENMDFWYNFANEMQTVLKEGINSIEDKKMYIVALEDSKDVEEQ
ncbi:hypothetical protein H6A65_01700 [Mediterraneibacter glycyrrhizinilyticus]|uniref:hypothetical protein n=1 Tax=Mediterraneibacter glycyrrhizinilyticus TaxID=342942 RepID=UPI00196000D0|nr:hypothetical protein [Mediterraneibacter glycyrrhizinilyticus]MBM6750220.1 hypothetical protein [Mediterraneibacter glycyrrhizinilyticus]